MSNGVEFSRTILEFPALGFLRTALLRNYNSSRKGGKEMFAIIDSLDDLVTELRGLSEALTTVAYSVGEKNDNMLGHDIYSELLFLARSTKKMETEVKNLIED